MTPIILADTVAQARAFAYRRGFASWRTCISQMYLRGLPEGQRVYVLGTFRNPCDLAALRGLGYRPVIAVPAW